MRGGLLIAVCALAAATVIAGCGGGGGGSSYSDKASKICKDFENGPHLNTGDSPDKAQAFVDSAKGTALKLSALTPPADKKASLDRFVTLLNQFSADLSKAVTAVRAKDRATLLSIQADIQALPAQLKTARSAAGLPSCGT